MSGELPRSWGALAALEVLDVSRNPELGGALPVEWKGMRNLRALLAT